MPVCLPACACLPARPHLAACGAEGAHLPACLRLRACLPAYLPALTLQRVGLRAHVCLPVCLPACLRLRACLPACLPALTLQRVGLRAHICLPACLPACLPGRDSLCGVWGEPGAPMLATADTDAAAADSWRSFKAICSRCCSTVFCSSSTCARTHACMCAHVRSCAPRLSRLHMHARMHTHTYTHTPQHTQTHACAGAWRHDVLQDGLART